MPKPEDLRIDIDQNRLDEEWIFQPRQYLSWARELADARLKYDEAKTQLDLTKAEMDAAVRLNPQMHGIGKITEAQVTNAVIMSPQYKDAMELMNSARHNQNILQATVDALDQRRRALEGLVQLHVTSYYSEPRDPRMNEDQREQFEHQKKKATRHMWKDKEAKAPF